MDVHGRMWFQIPQEMRRHVEINWGDYPMDDSPPELYPQVMNTIFNHTRNSLPEKTRIEIATLLQARLADSIDLMMQAKQTLLDLKGSHFFSPRGFFDKSPAERTSISGSWKPTSSRKSECIF